MIRPKLIGTAVLVLAAGAGSFFATLASGRQGGAGAATASRPALHQWLDLPADRAKAVQAADPTFEADLNGLTVALQAEREKLAVLLEDPASADETVLAQVEKAIAAQGALERRVAKHVLAIRGELTAEQRKRLLGMTASGVRRANRHRRGYGWHGGQQQETQESDADRGQGHGPGGRWGRGGRGGR